MAELTGKVLAGRYRVDAFLGRGGMADVYKVWDQQRAVFLAMKVLHADLADDRVFLRRFEHEAQTLARLQHPNIVRFYGLEKAPDPAGGTASSGATGNSAFIAPVAFILMDYIDGLTLRKEIFLNKAGLAPERILEVMRPVCAALFYAHQMGLAHCDIKPANIMLHRNGAVYLADFGIARMTEASAQSPGGMGTPAYMAPEQLHGREPTFAADIYSLGVVLFEMITGGRRPFTGDAAEDAEKITWEKDHLPPIAPRKYAPSISPELESVILRCLERKPERRYHTALDLLEALQAAAGGAEDLDTLLTPTTQEEDSSPGAVVAGLRGMGKERASWLRFLRRPRLLTRPYSWLLAGLAAVLLAGLGLSILARDVHAPSLPIPGVTPPGASGMTVAGFTTTRGNRATAAVTQSPRAGSTPPAENPTGALATSGAAAPQPTSLGGSQWIAYAFDAGDGVVQVWVMQPSRPDARRVITHEAQGACQPAWSPDGQKIAYTTPCHGPSVYYPGATIKVAHLNDSQVERLPLTGGGISAAFDPAWSPDGQTLAYTAIAGEQIRIHAYTFTTGKIAVLAANGIKNAQPAWSPDGEHIAYITSDAQMLHPDALWLMGKSGDSQEVFSNAGPFSAPAWSPDGQKILVSVSDASNMPILAVFARDNPSRGPLPLLAQAERLMQGGAYAPDGRWVAYWSGRARDREIFITSTDGKETRRLTTNTLQDFQPAWSPR